MTAISILLRLILAKAVTEAIQMSNNKGRDCTNNDISVVNFLSLEMGSNKKSLDDIPSLAVLGNDPRAALPQSFTICSTILSGFKTTPHNVLMFFNLFGNDREQILPAVMFGENFYTTKVASGQIPTVFPNQWLRSRSWTRTRWRCMDCMLHWPGGGNPWVMYCERVLRLLPLSCL